MPHIKNALIRFRIIDKMLRNKYKPFPSKKELREMCEESLYGSTTGNHICDSTIEKDLFNMKMEHDAPIKYSKREGGYYYEDENYSINDIPLTEDELTSIKYAVDTLHQFKDAPFFKEFGNAIDKIVDRISIGSDHNETAQYIQFESVTSVGGNEHLPLLLEALQRKKQVWFLYTPHKDHIEKPRKVTPLFLKEYRNRWYLISYDEKQKGTRTFALERMDTPKLLDEDASFSGEFNSELYFQDAMGITSYKGKSSNIHIKAKPVAARYLKSQPLHESQEISIENEKCTHFSMKLLVSEELIRTIMSYGGEIEVIEPYELRNIILERIKNMNQLYELS
jgi:predicted DNA-binding transcriptional regulator YafY